MLETRLIDIKDRDMIIDYLRSGKIVAFPTDTVFGLGCIYDD